MSFSSARSERLVTGEIYYLIDSQSMYIMSIRQQFCDMILAVSQQMLPVAFGVTHHDMRKTSNGSVGHREPHKIVRGVFGKQRWRIDFQPSFWRRQCMNKKLQKGKSNVI